MVQDLGKGIRSLRYLKDADGVLRKVRIVFGPHHFVELHADEDGKVEFFLGATHHGICADASTVPSELESLTDELRAKHPKLGIDGTPTWSGNSI